MRKNNNGKKEPLFHPNNPLNPRNWGLTSWAIALVLISVFVRQIIKADCNSGGQICQLVEQLLGS